MPLSFLRLALVAMWEMVIFINQDFGSLPDILPLGRRRCISVLFLVVGLVLLKLLASAVYILVLLCCTKRQKVDVKH